MGVQVLADQLTLSQPDEADFAPHILLVHSVLGSFLRYCHLFIVPVNNCVKFGQNNSEPARLTIFAFLKTISLRSMSFFQKILSLL